MNRDRRLEDPATNGVVVGAGHFHLRQPSRPAWRLLGWTEGEMGTQTQRDQVVPEDQVRIATELTRLARSGARDLSLEFRVKHRDGSRRWIESTGTNLLDDPNVRAIVGNDITARKLAEAALRETTLVFWIDLCTTSLAASFMKANRLEPTT
jgi:PAS domain S-box-containing protein